MAVDVASDKQAEDIVMLDIRQLANFADYFVIMSAGSRRQLEALQEDLVAALKESGVFLHRREGTADSGWVLLDYSDVIIHLFGAEERDYYRLDQLWSGAAQVVRVL
jgi:ribosome-associated protein